jgi:DNA-binding transcriptional ArsR family regulator
MVLMAAQFLSPVVERLSEVALRMASGRVRIDLAWNYRTASLTGCYRISTMNDLNSVDCCAPGAVVDVPSLSLEAGEQELAALAKALGHPARVRILRLLLARDACVCGEIVDQLPLAQATVSQHLKVLRESGLVRGEIDGPRVCYCVDRERLGGLAALIGQLCDVQADRVVPESMEALA